MKNKIYFLILIVNANFAIAQTIQINGKPLDYYIANTAVFEENQTLPHTPIAPFDSQDQTKEYNGTKSTWTLSLNGTWQVINT